MLLHSSLTHRNYTHLQALSGPKFVVCAYPTYSRFHQTTACTSHRRQLPFSLGLVHMLQAAMHEEPTAEGSPVSLPQPAGDSQGAASLVPAARNGVHIARPLLLVSDLDDTLVGRQPSDDEPSAAFKTMWERSRALGAHCKLAINTGRTLPLFEHIRGIKGSVMVQPDAIIAGVGTRIYHACASGWMEDAEWTARMNEGWDSSKARAVMDALLTTFGKDNVEYREPVEMHDHKLTVLYQAGLRPQLLPKLHADLDAAQLQATVIEGESRPPMRFIDLIPKAAGKGAAMEYIRHKYGYETTSTVAAGDGCNDLLMLQQATVCIVVGNCAPEVRAWATGAQQQQQQRRQQGTTQALEDGLCVYIASQTVAAGVLEGLQALGFLQLPACG